MEGSTRASFSSLKAFRIFKTKNEHAVAGHLIQAGYWVVGVDKQVIANHRVVVAMVDGKWPTEDVDHIDRNKQNNRPNNLRAASRSENIVNAAAEGKARSATGVRNVYVSGQGYAVQVFKSGKTYNGGSFKSLAAAKNAAITLKQKLYAGVNCGC